MDRSIAVQMLPDGRHKCPKCLGGTEEEHSLGVRRDEADRVHWRCFRSSCGYAGGPHGVASVFAGRRREPRYFTRPIVALTDNQAFLVEDKFGIQGRQIEGYSPVDDRFVLGVYGPSGYNRRGVLSYSLSGAKPKSLTYNEKPDEPFLHYAGDSANQPKGLVIVEDWFSAEKVATTRLSRGVCLNGTYLNQEMVSELVEAAEGNPTWVALDRDAYTKTLLYLSRFREQFPGGLFAWSLAKDLKYETTERIREALVDGKVDFASNVERPERV